MSSLGPLFIPRKDMSVVPKSTDPEKDRFLSDLLSRIRTNELAIQRWANSVPRLAAVMGVATQVTASSTGQKALPLDGATNAFFAGIIDPTNDQIVIPTDGWYTLSATAQWGNSAPAVDRSGSVEVFVYKNGVTTPGSQIVSSGPMPEVQQTIPVIGVSAQDFQSFSFTSVFTHKDTLQPYAVNAIITSTGGDTTVPVKFTALALDFLGTTPTKVQ